ncbi:permease YjgP/YjgQ family [alpha proteobacterium HIMB5]|nr:permease YjgP/YjgQ family [alpha proteobacterium HIMB5]
MKKKIFENLNNEIITFFILTSLTLTLIIWILQAVNYLDIVSEDGHSLKTYFFYSSLNFPKIYSKVFLLSFFLSLFYILIQYEEKNQMLVFWINGVTKIRFLNKIILLSCIFCILSFILSFYLVPYTQDKARSFIRDSNLDFFPSLIKQKKFIDTVENLTIYLDEKENNSLRKVLIKDDDNSSSQLIISEAGVITNDLFEKNLKLKNGIIINFNEKKNLTSFKFEETLFDLNKYKTKTTITPKIQEINSTTIMKCLNKLYNEIDDKNIKKIDNLLCEISIKKNLLQELFKRVFLPFYLPLVGISACFVIFKTSNNLGYNVFKIKIFLLGIIFIILSQISIGLFGKYIFLNYLLILLPILMIIFNYITFLYSSKYNN